MDSIQPIKAYFYDQKVQHLLMSHREHQFANNNPIPLLEYTSAKFVENPYFIKTDNPKHAEFYFFPSELSFFIEQWCNQSIDSYGPAVQNLSQKVALLPNYDLAPERHVFFSTHDTTELMDIPGLQATCNVLRKALNERVLCMPYGNEAITVNTFPTLGFLSEHNDPLEWDISFVGNVRQPFRNVIVDSFEQTSLRTFFKRREKYWGLDKNRKQKKQHLRSLAFSFMVLSPRGVGLNSHRFYEAMSAGRVPVLITLDDAVLPFEDVVDYESCIIRIPAEQWDKTGGVVERWIETNGHDKLLEMGKQGKHLFHNELRRDHWPRHLYHWLSKFR
jgi:hypothetical protein